MDVDGPVCPACGTSEVSRVIYAGFPMWICDHDCSRLWGAWSFVLAWGLVPFNGVFFNYDGWYPAALWRWLRNAEDD